MELKPLYENNNYILVGLAQDHITEVVDDSLVVELDISRGELINGPWSGQKKLKFGFYYPIEKNEIEDYINKLQKVFSNKKIKKIEDLLLNPPKKAVESLIWLPERLKNIDYSNVYEIKSAIEQLVKIRHQLFEEALNYAMNNELKSINEAFDDGDKYQFELKHLDNSEDINLQLLVDLTKKVEATVDSIANLNKIDMDEFDV